MLTNVEQSQIDETLKSFKEQSCAECFSGDTVSTVFSKNDTKQQNRIGYIQIKKIKNRL